MSKEVRKIFADMVRASKAGNAGLTGRPERPAAVTSEAIKGAAK